MAPRSRAGLAMRWAWRQSYIHEYLSPNALFILVRLVDYWNVDKDDYAYPAIKTLAEQTHLSERAVKKATQELDVRNIISKGARVRNRNGKMIKKGNVYYFSADLDLEEERERYLLADKLGDPQLTESASGYWDDDQLEARSAMQDTLRSMSMQERERMKPVLAELRDEAYMLHLDDPPADEGAQDASQAWEF